MRNLILAFALIICTANSDQQSDSQATNDAIQALVDEGQDADAFKLAQEAAATGDTRAHEWLGWFYDEGRGTEHSAGKAAYHYRIAIDAGHNYARWRTGVMIDTGEIAGSSEGAVALFELAAEEDFSDALVSLAVMKATGRGTAQDYEASLDLYMRAARAGNSHGIQGVGILFALGQGVPKDEREAAAWFLVSAYLGNEVGSNNFTAITDGIDPQIVVGIVERAREIADSFGIDLQLEFDPDATVPAKSKP